MGGYHVAEDGKKTTLVNVPLDHIVISKEDHDQLVEDQMFLQCLQGAGVDNWDGYELAQEMAYPD